MEFLSLSGCSVKGILSQKNRATENLSPYGVKYIIIQFINVIYL